MIEQVRRVFSTALTWLLIASLCCLGLAPQSGVSSLAELLADDSFEDIAYLITAQESLQKARRASAQGKAAAAKKWYVQARADLTRALENNRLRQRTAKQYYKALQLLKLDSEYQIIHGELLLATRELGMDASGLPPALDDPPSVHALRKEAEEIGQRVQQEFEQAENGLTILREKRDRAKGQYEALLSLLPEAERASSEIRMEGRAEIIKESRKTSLQAQVESLASKLLKTKQSTEAFAKQVKEVKPPSVSELQKADQFPDFPMPLASLAAINDDVQDIHALKDHGSLDSLLLKAEEQTAYKDIRARIRDEINEAESLARDLQEKFKEYEGMFSILESIKMNLDEEKPLDIMEGHARERNLGVGEKKGKLKEDLKAVQEALRARKPDIASLMRLYKAMTESRTAFRKELEAVAENKKYQPKVASIVDISQGKVVEFKRLLQDAPNIRSKVTKLQKQADGLSEMETLLDRAVAHAAALGLRHTEYEKDWNEWHRRQRDAIERMAAESRVPAWEVPRHEIAGFYQLILSRAAAFLKEFPALIAGLKSAHAAYENALKDIASAEEWLGLADIHLQELAGEDFLNAKLGHLKGRKEKLWRLKERRAMELSGHVNGSIDSGRRQKTWNFPWQKSYADLAADAKRFFDDTDKAAAYWQFVKSLIGPTDHQLMELEANGQRVKQLLEEPIIRSRVSQESPPEAPQAMEAQETQRDLGKRWRGTLERMRNALLAEVPVLDPKFTEEREELLASAQASAKAAEEFIRHYGPMHEMLNRDHGAIRKLIRDSERKLGALSVAESQLAQEVQAIADLPDALMQRYRDFTADAGAAKERLAQLINACWRYARVAENGNGSADDPRPGLKGYQQVLDALVLEGPALLGNLRAHQRQAGLTKAAPKRAGPPVVTTAGQKTAAPLPAAQQRPQTRAKIKNKVEAMMHRMAQFDGIKKAASDFFQAPSTWEDLIRRLERNGGKELNLNEAEIAEMREMIQDARDNKITPKEWKRRLGYQDIQAFLFALHRVLSPLDMVDMYLSRVDRLAMQAEALRAHGRLESMRAQKAIAGDATPIRILLWNTPNPIGMNEIKALKSGFEKRRELEAKIVELRAMLQDPAMQKDLLAQVQQLEEQRRRVAGIHGLIEFWDERLAKGSVQPINEGDYKRLQERKPDAVSMFEEVQQQMTNALKARDTAVNRKDFSSEEIKQMDTFWRYLQPAFDGCAVSSESVWLEVQPWEAMTYFLSMHAVAEALREIQHGDFKRGIGFLRVYYGLMVAVNETMIRRTRERLEEASIFSPDVVPVFALEEFFRPMMDKDPFLGSLRPDAMEGSGSFASWEDLSLKEKVFSKRFYPEGIRLKEDDLLYGRIIVEMFLEYWALSILNKTNRQAGKWMARAAQNMGPEDVEEIAAMMRERKSDMPNVLVVAWMLQKKKKFLESGTARQWLPSAALYHAHLAEHALGEVSKAVSAGEISPNPVLINALKTLIEFDCLKGLNGENRKEFFPLLAKLTNESYQEIDEEYLSLADGPFDEQIQGSLDGARLNALKRHLSLAQRKIAAMHADADSQLAKSVQWLVVWEIGQGMMSGKELEWLLQIQGMRPPAGMPVEKLRVSTLEGMQEALALEMGMPLPALKLAWTAFQKKEKNLLQAIGVANKPTRENLLDDWAALQLRIGKRVLSQDRPRWEDLVGEQTASASDDSAQAERWAEAAL